MRKIFFQILSVGFCCGSLALTACGPGSQIGTSLPPDVESAGIVGGKEVSRQETLRQSVVALISQRADGTEALCTGTILDDQSILTAAHCVDEHPTKMSVIFSSQVRGAAPEFIRNAPAFSQNPAWKRSRGEDGDVAVVHFDGGLPKGFQAVRLASQGLDLRNGTEVLLVGYGVTNGSTHAGSGTLRETTSQVIGQKSARQTMTDGRQSSVCFGDSGGPGFVKQGNSFVQWGVASSVSNEACNESSIHTNVFGYEKWIKSTALRLGKKRSPRQEGRARQHDKKVDEEINEAGDEVF